MATALQMSQTATGPAFRNQDESGKSLVGKMNAGAVGFATSDTNSHSGSSARRPSGQRDRADRKIVGLRGRQNSLRRVKDSTDILREKSLQGQSVKSGHSSEHKATVRDAKARQFTVSNVGNNGRIYLKPIQRPQQQPPMSAQVLLASSKIRDAEGSVARLAVSKGPFESRDSVWTLLSHPMQPDHGEAKTPESFEMRTRTKRSFSQSTADTQLANERLEAGAFKIVIDRPDSAPSEQDPQDGLPALQVPIPHYRLGTPRFSARGTAFFHQSSYTKSSLNGEESSIFTGAEFENIFPKPPGIEAHHVISRRHSYAFNTYPSTPGSASASPHAYALYRPRNPITPEVFDMIAAAPNDQSIVKYSPINRDIIAATPARIIMQITSEKFLDYELLSDFFLTVRSYLSTHDLLSYLLARFEWALNRFDDNGRVVRVRAFAALRHWILNYFSYDFVTDRELRVQFCDRLNSLTRLLKSKTSYGQSDMKLISDLKKCWNGRCLVYWDNPSVASSESHHEMDIQPGGILGSRDSQLVHQSQLRASTATTTGVAPPSLTVNPATIAAGAQSISNWYSAVMEHGERQTQGHTRQSSTGTARSLPISPTSEQSMPILSCSIPAKNLKRAVPYANKVLGIQPVPTDAEGRRICPAAPSSLSNEPARPVAVHRRSGSFSDAARDQRAPLSSEVPTSSEAIAQELYHGNSMLRGFVVPPGPPYVAAAPTTPAVEIPQLMSQPSSSAREYETVGQRKTVNHKDPHMKSIIGNIRRALSSKHGGPVSQPTGAAIVAGPALSVGKSATLPLNVTYQALDVRQMQAFQNQSRIDMLALQVFEAWQRITAVPIAQSTQNVAIALESEPSMPSMHYHSIEQPVSMSDGSNRLLLPELPRPEISRLTSGVTDSSRSILIADDTGLNLSDLRPYHFQSRLGHPLQESEASGFNDSSNRKHDFGMNPSQVLSDDLTVPQMFPQNEGRSRSVGTEVERRSKLLSSDDFSQTVRPAHMRNASQATTTSMRRRASFHSTYAKHNQELSIDTNGLSSNASIKAKEAPARMLRRRPGGDLRANQNVHDLQGHTRPKSAGSVTTYAESFRDSQMLGFGEKITRTFTTMRKSPRDLDLAGPDSQQQHEAQNKATSFIRTHSSQHIHHRPSLQAAVAEFANIPDEDDEEGGIEATLLKLEGKYKSPLQSPVPRGLSNEGSEKASKESSQRISATQAPDDQVAARESAVESESSAHTVQPDTTSVPSQLPLSQSLWQPIPLDPVQLQSEPRETVISTAYAGSEDSYNSVPLLERGVDERLSMLGKGKGKAPWNGLSAREIEKSKKLKHGSIAPSLTTDSFLLDENDEFLSDVSSELSLELSLDTLDGEERVEQWTNDDVIYQTEDTILSSQQHPPSPPMTMENALSLESQTIHMQQQRKPPTPDPSPISQHIEPQIPRSKTGLRPDPAPKSRHMPFILGQDSELLAQQFTILEKEALREIDWRDLVDLRWSNSPASPLNWVDYLSTQDPLGIDLVTARFNVMVKWAISEVVLTEDIEERALTVMKYIHVAQQARKIHNYATLFQLTIALTSADCTRLSKTWDLVPTTEKDILQDLEILVSPRRNFHNLRTEMEKANADEGCIPVLGRLSLH